MQRRPERPATLWKRVITMEGAAFLSLSDQRLRLKAPGRSLPESRDKGGDPGKQNGSKAACSCVDDGSHYVRSQPSPRWGKQPPAASEQRGNEDVAWKSHGKHHALVRLEASWSPYGGNLLLVLLWCDPCSWIHPTFAPMRQFGKDRCELLGKRQVHQEFWQHYTYCC